MDYGGRTYVVLVVVFTNFRWHCISKAAQSEFKLSAICPLHYAVSDTKHPPL